MAIIPTNSRQRAAEAGPACRGGSGRQRSSNKIGRAGALVHFVLVQINWYEHEARAKAPNPSVVSIGRVPSSAPSLLYVPFKTIKLTLKLSLTLSTDYHTYTEPDVFLHAPW